MSAAVFIFAVTRKCAALGLAPGDTVAVKAGAEVPFCIHRPLPVPRGTIDALIESGALKFAEGQEWPVEDCHRLLDFLHPGVLRPFQDIVKGIKGPAPSVTSAPILRLVP